MIFSQLLKILRFQLIFMSLAIPLVVGSSLASKWIGTAVSPDSLKPQYTEIRTVKDPDTGAFDVEYLDTAGKVFATKSLKIKTTGWHPEIDFVDSRNKISYYFKHVGGKVQVDFQSPKESYSKFIQPREDYVWDSGIHFYILKHFDKILKSGDEVEIFLPEYGNSFRFSLQAKLLEDGQQLVTMRPANMFLKLFVEELKVWYKDKKFITKYEGISDIKDPKGENYNTLIYYKSKF